MNRIRFVFALAALLLWAPARPQTAEPQRGSLPSRELAPAQLLAELRKGGYILYFRHAATDFSQNDEKMKSFEDCANQRNLIDRGRSDARTAAAAIRRLGIPVERVLASPFCRTVETAQLLFGRAGLRVILEAGVFPEEGQLDCPDGAVALFENDDFRDALLGRVRRVDLFAIDREDEVGVLLDRAGFAQVRHDRALRAGALLDRAGKLRERDHGNLELLGEGLE